MAGNEAIPCSTDPYAHHDIVLIVPNDKALLRHIRFLIAQHRRGLCIEYTAESHHGDGTTRIVAVMEKQYT